MIRAIKDDITKVTGFDAIVNPANNSLLGGGGLDGMIHRVAGPQLKTECRKLNGCETGDSKLTLGYNLPSEYVIHSVGPIWMGGIAGEAQLLASCYTSALKLASDNYIRKIAFPPISTGEYGYPMDKAAKLAVATVSAFVANHPDSFDDVCFVLQDDLGFNAFSEELKNVELVKKAEPKKKPSRKGRKNASKDVDEIDELFSENDEDEASLENGAGTAADETSQKDDGENSADETSENRFSAEPVSSAGDTNASDNLQNSEGICSDTNSNSISSSADTQSIPEIALPETPPDFPIALYNKYHIDWLIDEVSNGNPHTYVCFYLAEKTYEFCQFSLWYQGDPIFINGRKYLTAQQYISAEKALLFNDFNTYAKIMNEPDPALCQKLGSEIRNFDEVIWKKCYREIIFNCNVGKYLSDKAFAEALMSTGDSVIIEGSPMDDILGSGLSKETLLSKEGVLKIPPQNWHKEDSDFQAKNELGFILMAVREFFSNRN
nr:macro domain-containing protein [Butyrivibrio sp. WCE2006]